MLQVTFDEIPPVFGRELKKKRYLCPRNEFYHHDIAMVS